MIELRGVARAYREGDGERRVLRGVDASFRDGEHACVIGRSGSGKTTLLNILSGIDRPDAGTVRIDGADLVTMGDAARTRLRRASIGFVFQFFNLVPTLTVEENLRLPLELNGVGETESRRRIAALLGRVGLADRAASFPDVLSGGEQQRVAVLRALVHEPRVVLADEPTGNLDATTGGDVMNLLTGLVRERGATLVVVTHSAQAAAGADRVLRMDDGVLREEHSGTFGAILS